MKSAPPEVLMRELIENARISGQKPLEKRLAELTIWFYNRRSSIAPENVAAKCAFLEKTCWIQMELIALLLERVRDVNGSKHLWIPDGMISQDGKHFS